MFLVLTVAKKSLKMQTWSLTESAESLNQQYQEMWILCPSLLWKLLTLQGRVLCRMHLGPQIALIWLRFGVLSIRNRLSAGFQYRTLITTVQTPSTWAKGLTLLADSSSRLLSLVSHYWQMWHTLSLLNPSSLPTTTTQTSSLMPLLADFWL